MIFPFKKRRSRNLEGCYAEHAPALLAYARSFGLNHHAPRTWFTALLEAARKTLTIKNWR